MSLWSKPGSGSPRYPCARHLITVFLCPSRSSNCHCCLRCSPYRTRAKSRPRSREERGCLPYMASRLDQFEIGLTGGSEIPSLKAHWRRPGKPDPLSYRSQSCPLLEFVLFRADAPLSVRHPCVVRQCNQPEQSSMRLPNSSGAKFSSPGSRVFAQANFIPHLTGLKVHLPVLQTRELITFEQLSIEPIGGSPSSLCLTTMRLAALSPTSCHLFQDISWYLPPGTRSICP